MQLSEHAFFSDPSVYHTIVVNGGQVNSGTSMLFRNCLTKVGVCLVFNTAIGVGGKVVWYPATIGRLLSIAMRGSCGSWHNSHEPGMCCV